MRAKRYKAYKPSGVAWLGDVPAHWEAKRLKYSASINDDALPETTDPEFEMEYVDISSVDAAAGITTRESLIFENAPSRARRTVRDGDTIVSTVRTYLRAIAPIRKPPKNLVVSTGFAVVRPRKVLPEFLSYALREASFVESVVARSVGVSYPAINASEVGDIAVPLPSETEQRAIAAFLDQETGRIDTLVAKKRELIERLQEKRTALISHAVTRGLDPKAKLKPSGLPWLGDIPAHWELTRIGFVSTKVGSGKTPRGGAESYVPEGVMLIRSQNVYDDGLRLEDVVFIDQETDTEMANSRVEAGDILLNITGASLGRCSLATAELGRANVNQHVCIVRPSSSRLAGEFGQLALVSRFVKTQIFADEEGASREGLNFDQVRNLRIALPPVVEQLEIASVVNHQTARFDFLVGKAQEAIKRLQEYRAALITAAVTGKIEVRSVNE